MPFLAQTSIQKFAPKKVKFTEVYKSVTKRSDLSSPMRKKIYEVLSKAGFDQNRASSIVHDDQPLTAVELKNIASLLNREKISGFEGDVKKAVHGYFRKEAVKQRNIAYVRKKNMLESLQENLDDSPSGRRLNAGTKTPSSNSTGSRPKLPF
ncbi:MAG: hypothetical protein WC518_02365 [Patescibacteria group bacterium]